MSNEIKAALHVAMEAIDAKLRHTGLKPGHENDLRAAKGVLRSMISNLPAASGQQEGIEAAFEHAMKTGTGFLRIEAIDPADVFHPAPAQQESEPTGHVVVWNKGGSGEVKRIEPIGKPGVSLARELEEGALLYTRAPAPAALTDLDVWSVRALIERIEVAEEEPIPVGLSTAFALRRMLATASAAPADE